MIRKTEPTRTVHALAALVCACALLVCGAPFAHAQAKTAPAQAKPAHIKSASPGTAEWKVAEELWYVMNLGGKPCGYSSEKIETNGDLVRTTVESELRFGRMGQTVTVLSKSVFVETAAGKPVEALSERSSGTTPVRSRVMFNADSMDCTEEQAGRTTAQRKPLPAAGWLTRNQAREFVRKRVLGGADTLEYTLLDIDSGMEAVRVTSERTASGTATVDDKRVTTSVWNTKNSLINAPSIEEFSADGVLVRTSTELGFGALEAKLCTKAEAKSQRGSAEVMAKSFVELKQNGKPLLRAKSAQLKLRAADGQLASLPTAGSQKATRVSPGEIVLDIAMDASQPAEAGEEKDGRYTRASVMIDSEEPRIKALTEAALQGVGDDPMARAEALRAAVCRHLVNKELGKGFASATEAVVSRSGDCSEHGALLAACLRAAGFPSRLASGLMYVEHLGEARNAYGWHMWAQALVNGTWVDLDAVLDPRGPRSNAGHILIITSSGDANTMDVEMGRIIEFVGDFEIEIAAIDGKPVAAPARAPAGAPAGAGQSS